MSSTKYSSEEILQMEIDTYNCQVVFDPEVEPDEQLTFETPIWHWRSIRDLLEPQKLAKVYHDIFKLTTPLPELENILANKENNLQVFCDYISKHATRQVVSPIVMMGKSCITAGIYRTLISNLKERGVKTEGIKPSSEFVPLFYKYGSILLTEVNKLAPGSLTKFEYQDNWIVKRGRTLLLVFFFLIIIVPTVWHFHWTLLIPLALGLITMFIGRKFKPAKEVIGGYYTVRDLILGMESQLNKAN
jgi:hypothetical protein